MVSRTSINTIISLLTQSYSHLLGSHEAPGTFQHDLSILPAPTQTVAGTRTQKCLCLQGERSYVEVLTYQPFFFLLTENSQPQFPLF